VLAPVVLAVLFGYSYAKRFTSFSHLILGLALALAPGGVWYALTAEIALLPVWMMLGIVCWVAGFDILYSCQDSSFDRQHALWSIPARLGNEAAFFVSRLLHVAAVVFFAVFGYAAGLGVFYWIGLVAFALLLLSQHRLVSPSNLERIDAAFFTRNGAASVVYFFALLVDVLW
jgi:4-hydroxybenzoate polyprenyltransferase